MKTYRFVTKTHEDVAAETLENAIETFNRVKRSGLAPGIDAVLRIEVTDEKGDFVPVDRPLRAEYMATDNQEDIRLSA